MHLIYESHCDPCDRDIDAIGRINPDEERNQKSGQEVASKEGGDQEEGRKVTRSRIPGLLTNTGLL
jgi:hypothetical protein